LAYGKDNIHIPGLSWVREENLHITVLFLGETEESNIVSIEQKLSSLCMYSPFTLHCKEIKAVSRRGKVSMIWAAFEDSPAFVELATRVSEVVNHPADHAPLPHVTLARVKRGVSIKAGGIEFPVVSSYRWQVEKIGLWASVLSPQGSQYTVLREWGLRGRK
jgi:2'-5' RNA ligase